jgi:beta-glucosidase-like glycosyl hydrolase
MSRIDESCQRVLDMKEKIGLFNDEPTPCTPPAEAKKMINDAAKEISEKAITLLYDRNELLPLSKDKVKSVAIVYISHAEWGMRDMDVIKREFEARGAEAKIFDCIDLDNRDEIFKHDLILYVGYMSQHNPMGLPSFSGRQIKSFFHAFTDASERSIGVSVGYPYLHFDCMAAAGTFIITYSIDDNTLIGLVKGIYGEIPFVGKSPVDIEPKLRYVYC